jgi:UDP-N-acetylglucosamine 2-epimerase (non-hydrolysing)
MTRLLLVAGTRPEAIKMAPVIEHLQKLNVNFMFVWSGQHYDYEMSRAFFDQLGLPDPDYDLNVRSGSHSDQTARAIVKLEKIIRRHRPSLVVSEGDTNTVAAAALVSVKSCVPFAHVEAGLRSWNMMMPEEINRKIADSVSSLHFAPTKLAALNLLFEGISPKGLHLTGNTIVDIVDKHKDTARQVGEELLARLSLEKQRYLLVTVHRAENTDNPSRMRNIARALGELSKEFRVVFPVHPRTRLRIAKLGLQRLRRGVTRLKPVGYWEFLGLLMNCLAVITDSGGVTEEACTLKIPCVTLRYNTERPETLMRGNVLAGDRTRTILSLVRSQTQRSTEISSDSSANPLGDGNAGQRIAVALKKSIEANLKIVEPDLRKTPFVTYRLLRARQAPQLRNHESLVAFDKFGLSHVSRDVKYRSSTLVRLRRSCL